MMLMHRALRGGNPVAASDTTPNAFTFTDQTDVSLSSTITSAAITVSGIDAAATITVSGGSYDINSSGSFTTSPGTVNNGDTVRARHTSSGSNSTATNTVVTIGGVSDTFTSTTEASGGTFLYNNPMTGADPIAFAENGISLSANAAVPSVITSNPADNSIDIQYTWLDPVDYPASLGTGERTSRMSELRIIMSSEYPELWTMAEFIIPSNYYHPSNNDPVGYTYGDSGSYNNKLILYFEDDYEDGPFLQSIELHPHDTESGASKGSIRTFSIPASIDVNSGYGQMEDMIMLSDRGKTVRFYFRFVRATSANNDGICQVWKRVDGVTTQVCNITNGAWYSATQGGFDEGYFLGYANSAFPAESAADNVIFKLTAFQIATSNQWGLS